MKYWPSLCERWRGKQVRIWSGQWEAYWRPNGAGYTTDGLEAGVYDFSEALARTSHCGPEKRIEFKMANVKGQPRRVSGVGWTVWFGHMVA